MKKTTHKLIEKMMTQNPELFLSVSEEIQKHLGTETAYVAAYLKEHTKNNIIDIVEAKRKINTEINMPKKDIDEAIEKLKTHKYIKKLPS